MSKSTRKHAIRFTEPTRTKQEFKTECNINSIMSRYERSGMVDHINQHQAQYGDFSEIGDYQDAMNLLIRADDLFYGLPAKLRRRFDNDPAKFLTFCENPDNHDELVELGLVENPKINKKTPQKTQNHTELPSTVSGEANAENAASGTDEA